VLDYFRTRAIPGAAAVAPDARPQA
jgi:hypothetical protein